ncbi:MAG: DNA translocase FtsK 4TM domain-containing protein [Chitinophagaceae bacterium]|jgi:S-DNA-T family DNA segregation ATPase FtsK/SpoIIIE|nr:DNA translocase FtsK 4TM domain-containing protein [Chitinophagaceae bacterium]MBK8299397.1 DNA translocase FtsK 4TM domain-containing protein [Chitinophagaceae bacterium]MBK9463446.1 DNA translocase FtsK 4TM domain-containing protein [Chitinophagaceae bacterium]MBK9659434.1 DNA translocase FtsK 4TM domain-containing protein [Chitinophagaceae bacterium]MBL0067885.1 DNA translocase FtsK 4TM domain-containing protein [Chitinophagaceae bacterium]
MATKLKKKSKNSPEKKPAKSDMKAFRAEKEETIDWKSLARDERTWKIVGAVFLVIATFLFISFGSYLFTWKEDQAIAQQGFSALLDNDKPVANLLGRFGAVISHFFIFKAFGVASFLICTFFFVVGVNLLFRRRVFSIWKNLKYVTVGLLVLSVLLSFVFAKSDFAFGGGVGDMINRKLTGALGVFGTGAVLLLLAAGYFIWQFNPAFNLPDKKMQTDNEEGEEENDETEAGILPVSTGKTINDVYSDGKVQQGNAVTLDGPVVINFPDEKPLHDFKIIEKEEPPEENIEAQQPMVEKEIVSEILHQHEFDLPIEPVEEKIIPVKEYVSPKKKEEPIELEIKAVPDKIVAEEDAVTVVENLPPYEPTLDLRDYKYPTLTLLETHGSEKIIQDTNELENNKNQIIATLRNYAIEIQKISATVGPTVTLYEIVPAPGIRISKIKNLEDDIALSLAALGIRIIAPIPGKGTIGIEVPNVRKTVVSMKTLLASEKFQNNNFSLPIAIGKKIDNENFIVDLTSMPHLLMAGATGQGKSVGLNAILVSLLYKKHPSQMKFVLIDPKKVELSIYRQIEKHFLAKLPGEEDAIITDTKKVVHTLNALCIEMDNRYDLLKEAGARNIKEYNEKFIKRKLNPQKGHQFLPFIVLVIDEFADLIMTAGKEVEMPIARLAQLARAIGIHLIIATQRPSVNIITGTIKANFPARIAFKVSSKIDSRTILDTGGAEQLIGKGDMLISHNGEVTRLQCAFVDTPEVEKIVDFIGDQRGYPQAFLLPEYIDEKELEGKDFDMSDRDSLFEDAARLIVQNQIGSTSLLQRRMKLGYNRAGRLMDQLEAAGVVGPNQGSKARDVLIKTEMELQQHLDALG